ncbi:hypothetical protein ACVD54_003317 [Enterobacter mori]|uniref:hypothetical protein n=1 Tax=Enterobacter mori TaxID=539813 RepID=UPI0028AC14C6|nr:hypothetical protein [Enterobacter mori]HED2471038.1 hypothetical protein [Enterobacter mori]
MNLAAFLLYAVPALFMTASGSYIPTLEVSQSWKFTIYVLCVLLTFVYKFYADDFFKKKERRDQVYQDNINKQELVRLKKEKESLENLLMQKTLEHGQELNNFVRKINRHLKTNIKNGNNDLLWTAVDSVLLEIEEYCDNLQKSLMPNNKKVTKNRKAGI